MVAVCSLLGIQFWAKSDPQKTRRSGLVGLAISLRQAASYVFAGSQEPQMQQLPIVMHQIAKLCLVIRSIKTNTY
jgi:hypothetical protein